MRAGLLSSPPGNPLRVSRQRQCTPWGIAVSKGEPKPLRRAGTALRVDRLLLLVGVVAVALRVLILHQLPLNHPTAAGKQLSAPTQDTSTDTTPRLSMMTKPRSPSAWPRTASTARSPSWPSRSKDA